MTIAALFEGNGQIKGYAKTLRDVTDLMKSQEALEAKEEELRVVVESAPVPRIVRAVRVPAPPKRISLPSGRKEAVD